jgi:hypothetical protein
MKHHTLRLLTTLMMTIFLVSCGSNPEKELLGTWKVENVQTDFNEKEVTPEMLAQVVDMQKQTYFRFMSDSVMVIISSNNTHEANWTYNEEENMIMYFFEGMETRPFELGKLVDDKIIQESETALGKITTIYRKDK